MKFMRTMDADVEKTPILMCVYGNGGVGKTTFAATAPDVAILDCENGTKYFKQRGINAVVAKVESWKDIIGVVDALKNTKCKTVVIDPVGELMQKLQDYLIEKHGNNSKLVQRSGDTPTISGWGWLKKQMRRFLTELRDSGLNVIVIAHVMEDKDDTNQLIKRPALLTSLSQELVNLVDIVGYMTAELNNDTNEYERVIHFRSNGDRFIAKDRTGQLPEKLAPDFKEIQKIVNNSNKVKKENK